MIDESKLVKPRKAGSKVIAQCPACAEAGRDKACDHFALFESGAFHCIADDSAEHRERIFALIGKPEGKTRQPFAPIYVKPVRRPSESLPEPMRYPWQKIDHTKELRERAATGRKLPAHAFLIGEANRFIHYASACAQPSWTLSDPAGRIHEARPIDGGKFPSWKNVSERKTHTRCNEGGKSWPIGIDLVAKHPDATVLLVEGSADFVAALLVCEEILCIPIAVLGSCLIHHAALPILRNRRVFIAIHADEDGKGRQTAMDWARQLREVGATVSGLILDRGHDLNDAVAAGRLAEIREALR